MNEMYKKIDELCRNRQIKIAQLCRETGIKPSVLSELKYGRTNKLSASNTSKIASYFGVPTNYLLGLEGPSGLYPTDWAIMGKMFRAKRFDEKVSKERMSLEELAENSGISVDEILAFEEGTSGLTKEKTVSLCQALGENPYDVFHAFADRLFGVKGFLSPNVISNSQLTSKPCGIRIPVYGDVAAGIPIEAAENIVDYEEISASLANSGSYYGLRIKGDSMEPRIREGDVVIVRKQEDVDTGDVAIVLIAGNSATVKRVKKEPSGLSLIPNNPAYDILYFSAEETHTLPVKIVGKVIELRGKF